MSRGTLFVRFPDGEVRYGIYNGTCDSAAPFLVESVMDAWDTYYGRKGKTYDWDWDKEAETVPVDIATNYGGGFFWTGQATADRKYLTEGHDPYDIEYGPMGPIRHRNTPTDGEPEWAK